MSRHSSSKALRVVDEGVNVSTPGVRMILPDDGGEVGGAIMLRECVEECTEFLNGRAVWPLRICEPEPFDVDEGVRHSRSMCQGPVHKHCNRPWHRHTFYLYKRIGTDSAPFFVPTPGLGNC